jgi:hypothetical protein
MKKLICLFALVILGFLILAEAFAQNELLPKGYYVISSKKCPKGLTIQVLRDRRLGLNAQNASIGIGALPALLRLIQENGKVCDSKKLEYPMAWLDKKTIKPGGVQNYFLTQDYCTGSLAMTGLTTSVFFIKDKKIEWAKCYDSHLKNTYSIQMEDYFKARWKIVNDNKILYVNCSGFSEETNETTYSRYSFEKGRWNCYSREVKETWIDPEGTGFPSKAKFP